MAIWVDADACPNVIKEILFRAAERTQTPLTLVANQPLRVPPSRFIRTLRVEQGFDVADNEIVRQCAAGDLVITADIPLAARRLPRRDTSRRYDRLSSSPLTGVRRDAGSGLPGPAPGHLYSARPRSARRDG